MLMREMRMIANNSVAFNTIISSSNVGSLKEHWNINTDAPVSSDPIIYGSNVYFTDWEGYAYCADKKSGKLLWKVKVYSPPTPKTCGIDKLPFPIKLKQDWIDKISDVCIPYIWNGLAGTGVVYKGVWYMASIGGKNGFPLYNAAPGKLFALDINTQKILWEVALTEHKYGGGLAKLLIHKEHIYVGICGIDEGVSVFYQQLNMPYIPETVGSVVAFHMKDGKKLWETKTIGMIQDDNLNAKGAGVWCSFALCPTLNLLYFGTGNNYGEPPSKSSDAIVAIDCHTGKLVWQNQVIKGDTWMPGDETHPDDDFGSGPQLFEILDNMGHNLPVVGIGNKDGYYYVFNRSNGKMLWSSKIFTGDHSGSGIRGNAAISNGCVYVWSNNGWDEEDSEESANFNITIACLDANTGEKKWSMIQKSAAAIGAGLLCNDVYVVGDISGNIYAYDASNGLILTKKMIFDASVSSSLVADEDMLYVGVGMPKMFGGLPRKGVYAFKIKNKSLV